MEDTLFAPSPAVRTADPAEQEVREEPKNTNPEGTSPDTAAAPFIAPADGGPSDDTVAAGGDAVKTDGAAGPVQDADSAPSDVGDGGGEAIGPGTSEAKSVGTTPLSNEHKSQIVLKALKNIEQSIHNLVVLLETDLGGKAGVYAATALHDVASALSKDGLVPHGDAGDGGRVTEGVFNGHNMVGSDGKIYTVPPNYASKSKLVEGDLLKLTITPRGSFIYKQIGPIERSRVVATLGFDHTNGEWYVVSDDRRWSVIKASVTYFKGEPGDEIVILIPKNEPSKWAAVENIIKKDPLV